jgi:antitoxin (DNA-binding transcriptional repressor) of toxin-antitoxin stability system
MRTTTTRALRTNLSATMAHVARGEEVIVTRRGVPYVRMLPPEGKPELRSYPLRSSVVRMAEDFDAPLTEPWAALDP